MKLNQHEIAQPLWHKLSEHYEAKLADYRARIENPRLQEAQYREYAIKIDACKEFLALAKPGREQETDAGHWPPSVE